MRPRFEQVSVEVGQSWTLFDRRLPAFPFNWHYHPEYELTLTLDSMGERFVGDHVASYGDGDLVLVGPNLPHAWQSRAALQPPQPHRALVAWFTREWADPREELDRNGHALLVVEGPAQGKGFTLELPCPIPVAELPGPKRRAWQEARQEVPIAGLPAQIDCLLEEGGGMRVVPSRGRDGGQRGERVRAPAPVGQRLLDLKALVEQVLGPSQIPLEGQRPTQGQQRHAQRRFVAQIARQLFGLDEELQPSRHVALDLREPSVDRERPRARIRGLKRQRSATRRSSGGPLSASPA